MRYYDCFIYHLENNKLIQNNNQACWAGLNKPDFKFTNRNGNPITLDNETKDYIYIDKYIESEITDKQRKRIVYLINKITPCKFTIVKKVKYIQYKLLNNHHSNLLLLNFIRILWYKNGSFNNEQFFIDICKRKPKNLDYLEFMMICIKNNVSFNTFNHGNHSFVYPNIIPKTKEMLYKYTRSSMCTFLQCKIEDVK